jgi:hypothetical protein
MDVRGEWGNEILRWKWMDQGGNQPLIATARWVQRTSHMEVHMLENMYEMLR